MMKIVKDYIRVVKSADREARVFLFATVAYWLGMTLVQLYLNFYLQALGLDQGWIGAINAAPQITMVVMTFVIGGMSRRLGHWLSMTIGTVIAGSALVLTALSSEAWQILLTSMVMGFGGGFVWSNAGPFMMQHSEESSRATLFSLQAALGTLTGFIAFLGGGILPGLVSGITGEPQDGVTVLRWTMLSASVFYFLSLIPMFLARPKRAPAMSVLPSGTTAQKEQGKRKSVLPANMRLVSRLLMPGALVALGAGMTYPS
jgi:MFS family permease